MFNRISSITLAILLFLVLFGTRDNFYFFITGVAGLVLATLAVNFKRLNFTWPHLLLPTIYLIGIGSTYALITNHTARTVFLAFSAIAFYFLEIKLGKESHFLQNAFLLSVFAWYLGIFAGHYYFPVSTLILAVVLFMCTYLFSIQGFAGFTQPAKKYFHFLLALLAAEAGWGLALWPTHYFVNAVVLFCLFYLVWLFAFSAFFGKLNKAKISLQIVFIVIVLVLVLSTAAWRPLR